MAERKPLMLVHGYGFNEEGRDKPDIRGRLTVLAAQELLRQREVCQVAITGGSQQRGEPELAGPMFRQFHRNNPGLAQNGPDIIVSSVPHGTIGELKEFQRISEGVPADSLAVLATKTHLGRIKRRLNKLYGERAQDIKVYEVEEVLRNVQRKGQKIRRYDNSVEAMENSADERGFIDREAKLEKAERLLPFGAWVVDSISRFPYRWVVWKIAGKVLRK